MGTWRADSPKTLNNVWIDVFLSSDPIKFTEGGMRNLRKNRDNDCLYGWYWLI